MNWTRINPYAERSDKGQTISASNGADGWRYSAWGAPDQPGLSHWEWLEQVAREHYPRGSQIPQRCRLLGIFETAAEARAACEASDTSSTAAAEAA